MRLGIDIGGTKTHAVVVDGDVVVASDEAPSGRGPEAVVAVAADLGRRVLASVPHPAGSPVVERVGVCVPGLVDPSTGIVRQAVNLGVEELELGGAMQRALGLDVTVTGDVKAAALWVHRTTPAIPGTRLAYLNLGTGLAAALIGPDGVVGGLRGAAGEIGHIPVADSPPCRCGQVGCLEALASGTALHRIWGRSGPEAGCPFAAALDGDALAQEAVDSLCAGTARAIQILVLAGGATDVVIGGGLTALGDPLRDGISGALQRSAAATPLLSSLRLHERFTLRESTVPLAALGAALAAGQAVDQRRFVDIRASVDHDDPMAGDPDDRAVPHQVG
ncbi:ROK family protein [Nostocoides sp. F2B08]|uniref:ROK family protein n=1 Tax=Nostocoides sp. F2B08 TaxID=2653936 RepID=UPI0012637BA1|nr:ROK family protein [Tetrasphaera sp. F2B08]KAB7745365.1 ROK family protein [Tetrasphaera sp. F2B08]